MLVFVSDIHLTDGTSGRTIEPGAFGKFCLYLENMAAGANAKEMEIVFLGDLFDVIRSEYWLGSPVRPWSGNEEVDAEGRGLGDYTREILERIIRSEKNSTSLECLKNFRMKMENRGVKVKCTYLMGNHDWLINRFADTRIMAARALGMENPGYFQTGLFMLDNFWEAYRVVARHGDIYDSFNCSGSRDASSLGDAIVIDLINKFPHSVSGQIGADCNPELALLLKELDNIRPLIDVPLWIQSVCHQAGTKDTMETVKRIWNQTVDQFLKIDFVKKYDKPWEFDIVDQLQLCLKISEKLSLETLLKLPLRLFMSRHDDYAENAWNEQLMQENRAAFAVYGHTHVHKIQPLDKVQLTGGSGGFLEKAYFNTGTWRKIHVRSTHSEQFLGWHVMTFVAFYLASERGEMKFEVWNGALG